MGGLLALQSLHEFPESFQSSTRNLLQLRIICSMFARRIQRTMRIWSAGWTLRIKTLEVFGKLFTISPTTSSKHKVQRMPLTRGMQRAGLVSCSGEVLRIREEGMASGVGAGREIMEGELDRDGGWCLQDGRRRRRRKKLGSRADLARRVPGAAGRLGHQDRP